MLWGESREEYEFSGIQGAQVGILRRVFRTGASQKVIVEPRCEEGERIRQADNRRMVLSKNMPGAAVARTGNRTGARGI